MRFLPFDGDEGSSKKCLGCGERIRYNEVVAYNGDEDFWVHEGCAEDIERHAVGCRYWNTGCDGDCDCSFGNRKASSGYQS